MRSARQTTGGSAARTAARMLSDVFFGIAVGLLGYYALTGLVTGSEQAALRDEAPVEVLSERVTVEGPTLDFDGWRSQDARYWSRLAEGRVFGRIVASKIGLDAMVVKGVAPSDLRKGPGWIEYTSPPGPTGNTGVSGHRTTYGAPFRRIDRLRPGDTIRFYSPYRRYTYRVKRVFSVTPDRVDVVADTKTPTLTLTACHPPYSARLRIIVQSDLIEVKRLRK